jgi:hypothetical protein
MVTNDWEKRQEPGERGRIDRTGVMNRESDTQSHDLLTP